jgi:hypothetical protein
VELILTPEALPFVNCANSARFPQTHGFAHMVFKKINLMLGDFSFSKPVLSAWLNRFSPENLCAQEVLDVFKR